MRPLLASIAILGALALASCSGRTEGVPPSEAPSVTATAAPEVTHTPEVTLAELDPPPGRIVYACDDGWCEVASDGGDGSPILGLPPVVSQIAPSPDGTLLAYYEQDEGSRWLGVAESDGSEARRLTEVRPLHDPVAPVWSLDMSTIFVEQGAPPPTNALGGPIELLAVDVRTGESTVPIDASEFFGGAQISPDGSTIAYLHQNSGPRGGTAIRTTPVGGGEMTELTDPQMDSGSHAWLSDERMAFVASRAGSSDAPDLFIIDPEDASLINISDHPAVDVVFHVGHFPAAVSPDGEWVAFLSDRSGSFELHVARTDGSEVRQISTATNATASLPSWSPDSSMLAYSATIEGRQGVWLARIEDGATAYLASGSRPIWLPAASPPTLADDR